MDYDDITDHRRVIQEGIVGFKPTGEYRGPRAGEFYTWGNGYTFQALKDMRTAYTILEADELIRVEIAFTVEVLGQELPVGDLIALRDTLNSLPLDDLAAAETALSA